MRIYTKSGDSGTTALISGERVEKYDDRVEAYGTVDELTAFVALLSDKMRDAELLQPFSAELDGINSILMNVEAHLAAGDGNDYPLPELSDLDINFLEERIDQMQGDLPSITKFTIPGGCELNSLSHVCRTICRRAERRSIVASTNHAIEPNVLRYLNRLSDYFYILGRTLSVSCGAEEVLWIPSSKK